MDFTSQALNTAFREGFSSYSGIILNSLTETFVLEDLELEIGYSGLEVPGVEAEKEQLLSADRSDSGICYLAGGVNAALFWDKEGKISSHVMIPGMEFSYDNGDLKDTIDAVVERILILSSEIGVPSGTLTVTYGTIIIPWEEIDNISFLG